MDVDDSTRFVCVCDDVRVQLEPPGCEFRTCCLYWAGAAFWMVYALDQEPERLAILDGLPWEA